MAEAHDCVFPEIEILPEDEDVQGNLKVGMKVLTPCSCGETPRDHLELLVDYIQEYTRTLVNVRPDRPLFHWAPASRRKQILRWGLRPAMRPTTSLNDEKWKQPYVCFGDSPSWAWALSGGMRWTPEGEWDLWQTRLDDITEPVILPGEERPSGIYEVRTEHRVFKRHLWYVASRIK